MILSPGKFATEAQVIELSEAYQKWMVYNGEYFLPNPFQASKSSNGSKELALGFGNQTTTESEVMSYDKFQ